MPRPQVKIRLFQALGIVLAFTMGIVRPAPVAAEDKTFDAKGFDPNRAYMSQLPFEHIDPLTGNVLLTFTDLTLPGNAGFDLRIQRTYNAKIYKTLGNTTGYTLGEDSWAGLGWTLHMGRLIFPSVPGNPDCLNCPIAVEMPDGRRSQLYPHIDGVSTHLMTKEFWTYEHDTSGTTLVHILRMPNGVQYQFEQSETYQIIQLEQDPSLKALYVRDIVDAFGNTVHVKYRPAGSGLGHLIERIEQYLGGQQRNITFGYDSTIGGVETNHLRTMTYDPPGRPAMVWTYNQSRPSGYTAGYSQLDSVQPPEGPAWTFAYYDNNATAPWLLSQVTTPGGGTVGYQYIRQQFYIGSNFIYSPAVTTRTVGGLPSGGGGTWDYAYNSSTAQNVTTITSPCGPRYEDTFLGIDAEQPHAYRLGSLERRRVLSGSTEWEAENFSWIPSPNISTDPEGNHPGTRVPLLQSRTVVRGSATYQTTNTYRITGAYATFSNSRASNFGDYGRPERIDETGELARTITRTFFYSPGGSYPGFSTYIADKIDTEVLDPSGDAFTTNNDYDGNGFLTSRTVNGIRTTYHPFPSGNVEFAQDENGHRTSFTYEWGVVKKTTTPMGFSIDRTIFPEGLVASETRRGYKTQFDYDRLFRLTLRDTPDNLSPAPPSNDTIITYTATTTETSRGSSHVTERFDGFGRPVGTSNAVGVETALGYDSCGRRNYESYPFRPSTFPNIGSSYQFDPLDRVTRRTNPGGSFVRYDYSDGNGIDVLIREEEPSHKTFQDWSAFGDPRDARLMSVRAGDGSPEENTTSYTYNALGSLKTVRPQGFSGPTRRWNYYGPGDPDGAHGQLKEEIHPESGTVTYKYFADGRLRSRRDAQFGETLFGYDSNHRLLTVDRCNPISACPSGQAQVHDVRMTYDESDNRRTLNNGHVESTFDYDGVNRLRWREDYHKPNNITLKTLFTPNANDLVERIVYPSNSVASYFYDFENRIDRITRDGFSSPAYAYNFAYHPSGAILSYTAGNNQNHTTTFDPNRYWVTHVHSGNHLDIDYRDYDGVGNVRTIETTVPNDLGVQGPLVYDALSRLKTVPGWGASSFTYDVLGNRRTKQLGRNSTTYWYDDATQRLTHATGAEAVPNFPHDNNGNLTGDGTATFGYAPTNMVATTTVGSAVTNYRYDGDNLRKRKESGTNRRYYVHGPSGELLSEFERLATGPIAPVRDYVYAGSRLLASVRPPQLVVTPDVLTFTAAVSGGVAPAPKKFKISSPDTTSLSWFVSESTSWLSATPPTTGTVLPHDVWISVNAVGLGVGTHEAEITVTADGAFGSPKSVKVTLVVTPTPELVVQPSSLRFTMFAGGDAPPPQDVDILYAGGSPAAWTATLETDPSQPSGWLTFTPGSGSTPTSASAAVSPAGLPTGTYTGTITITSQNTPGSPRVVPVEFVIETGPGLDCPPGAWYCEPFEATEQGDLGGQNGWELPPPEAVSPQVAPDPRGLGNVMQLDPSAGAQANTVRNVSLQSIDAGFELSMQVMSSGVPANNKQIGKVEFFTSNPVAWGKTNRTFGALRFGSALYLQYGPNIYQTLLPQMQQNRWYTVKVEYFLGRIEAYVDGQKRFSTGNPLPAGQSMQAFAVTGWDFPGSAHVDLIQGRPVATGLFVDPLRLDLFAVGGGPHCDGRPDDAEAIVPEHSVATPDSRSLGARKAKVDRIDGRLPLRFEANLGQTDSRVKFVSRGGGQTLFLTPNEVVLSLRGQRRGDSTSPGASLRMSLRGGNALPEVIGQKVLPGVSNYLIGQDPSKWVTKVPHYKEVLYRQVYPGIDMVFHGQQKQLEYDLVVAPFADPGAVRIGFDGATAMRIDAKGDLIFTTAAGDVRQKRPVIYQERDGKRQSVEGGYVQYADNEIGFRVAGYDTSAALVIDPVLVYSTYLGGDRDDQAEGIAVDEDLQTYVVGTTQSLDFPLVVPNQSAPDTAFITKFAADGSHLVYSTYLGGGDAMSTARAIVVDPDGTAFITGSTQSGSFPVLNATQPTFGGGGSDAFLAQLDPTGVLTASTYLGGTGEDAGTAIARKDALFGTVVAGNTTSTAFATLTPTPLNPSVPLGGADAFAYRQPPTSNGTALVFFNGSGADFATGVAVDRSGGIYITGNTTSPADPLQNPFPASPGSYPTTATPGPIHVFATKLAGVAMSLQYAALVGGDNDDMAVGLAINPTCVSDCVAHVTGGTSSRNFPEVGNQIGDRNVFAFQINPAGTELNYSTRFGGVKHASRPNAIAVDNNGSTYITGYSDGQVAAPCTTFGVNELGAFVLEIKPQHSGVGLCAVLTSSEGAEGRAIAVDPDRLVYVAGSAGEPFPTTPDAFDSTLGGELDAFVAKVYQPLTVIEFSGPRFDVFESGGSTNIFVKRDGELEFPATVDYASTDGTATSPADYGAVSGTLTFAPGETELYFNVPVVNDTVGEESETANLFLSNPSGTLGYQSTATLRILDDDSRCGTFLVRDRALPTGPNWTAVVQSADPWNPLYLTLSAAWGVGPSTVTACAAPLPGPGTYTGTIVVTGDTGNSPQTIDVTLTIIGQGCRPERE